MHRTCRVRINTATRKELDRKTYSVPITFVQIDRAHCLSLMPGDAQLAIHLHGGPKAVKSGC